ncbi:MAG TPA: hypothetical protein VGP47_02195 [Parachlamydiaceae bacterium]|nr:hypothetical protein [Parachlamydiaceae bacterium]
MNNPTVLEACYKRYMHDISKWLPDGVINIDLEVLHELNLLNFHTQGPENASLTRYFHVVESEEKLTLVNEEFIVWIVPEKQEINPVTYTLIALNKDDEVRLELAFTTSGIYNNSHLVLRLLEKYLLEIQNTEEQLAKLEERS